MNASRFLSLSALPPFKKDIGLNPIPAKLHEATVQIEHFLVGMTKQPRTVNLFTYYFVGHLPLTYLLGSTSAV